MAPLQSKQRVSKVYNTLAGFYDHLRPVIAGPATVSERALGELSLQPDDCVLDIATGTGFGARRLLGDDRRVHGLDVTRGLLMEADSDPGLRAVDFVQGDAERLPYVDGAFNVVTILGAIQHFPDPSSALAEAHRVARPDGRLFVMAPERPTNPIAAWVSDRVFQAPTAVEIREQLTYAGWTSINCSSYQIGRSGRSLLGVTARARKR